MIAVTRRRTLLPLVAGSVAVVGGLAVLFADDALPGDVMLEADAVDLTPLDSVPAATWDALAGKRIYFGHQSVGYDVISGIEEIRRRKPEIRLDVVETDDLLRQSGPVFAHSRVGRNADPDSKIADFTRRMESPGSENVDIAFVKLCYVDVVASTPVGDLLATYGQAMELLEAARPRTKFVRVTVPLTTPQTGLKARLRKLTGGVPGHDADNRARAKFNDLMRARFRGSRPIFDIAASESTLPDGSVVRLKIGPDEFPCLARCYTTDGGHLNEAGRLAAARDMLLVLAELAR